MNRLNARERAAAVDVILAEAPGGFTGVEDARRWLVGIESLARRLHHLYELRCNRELTRGERDSEDLIERDLRGEFKARGLGLYLNSDPRGNPVGILTPITHRTNTLGGDWRL